MTETGGTAWKQTTYYPLYYASLYGRGESLGVAVNVPTYDAKAADDVPYLDVAAVRNDPHMVTFFLVNRHPDEAMAVDIDLAGFAPTGVAEHVTMEDADLQAINTAKAPDRVVPKRGKGLGLRDGAVKGRLAPRSYHVLRVSV
jgi:alpha-N-arabinofuranosidase